jgi:DNA replication protein DnaC
MVLCQLTRIDLSVLDDLGPETLSVDQRSELAKLIDDRREKPSVIKRQYPAISIHKWAEKTTK